MITISVHGRLAFQPELILLPNGAACEIRVLSTRFAKGQEVTEAVTFICYDDMAEKLCSSMVRGQEISATGTQETQWHQEKQYVKYRMTWYQPGFKPRSEYQAGSQQGSSAGTGQRQHAGQRNNPSASRAAPGPATQRPDPAPGADNMGGQEEPGFY